MEVILLDKVANLGNLGDKVTVKNGFARNFLIPSGKAKPATQANLAEFEERRAELEKVSGDVLISAQSRRNEIEKLQEITISAKVGSEGKLYGSVGTVDIVDAVDVAGIKLEKKEIRLPEGNLREVGEYDITLHLHADVETTIKVIIVGEE